MNSNILKKCVDELNAKEPNISYIKGMLETLIEMSGATMTAAIPWQAPASTVGYMQVSEVLPKSDEEIKQEDLARSYATGPIAELS